MTLPAGTVVSDGEVVEVVEVVVTPSSEAVRAFVVFGLGTGAVVAAPELTVV
jgi:hypothetical protein